MTTQSPIEGNINYRNPKLKLIMSSQFDAALPSIRQVQTLIKDTTAVELKLVTGDLLTGKIGWQDQNCICLVDGNNQPNTVWRHAIAYLKPKKG